MRPDHSSPPAPATLSALLGLFLKLGMASFGGGLPGWMHREVVERRRWMTEESFLAGLALGQVLPGPNSVNLALHIGMQLRGIPGALMALLGLLGPPFGFILLLAFLYERAADLGSIGFVLGGLAAVGIGMTAATGASASRRMRGVTAPIVAAITFITVGVLKWPMIPVVLCVIPASILLAWRETRRGP